MKKLFSDVKLNNIKLIVRYIKQKINENGG